MFVLSFQIHQLHERSSLQNTPHQTRGHGHGGVPGTCRHQHHTNKRPAQAATPHQLTTTPPDHTTPHHSAPAAHQRQQQHKTISTPRRAPTPHTHQRVQVFL